jgi:diguanylate cyclase (GGDEF)-like protein
MGLLSGEQRAFLYEEICKQYELLRILDLLGTQLAEIREIDDYIINLLDEKRENLLSLKLRFVEDEFKSLEKVYFKYKYPLSDEGHPNARAFNQRRISLVNAEHGSENERRMQKLWRVDQIASLPFGDGSENSDLIGTILITKKSGGISQSTYDAIQELTKVFYPAVRTALGYFYLNEKKGEFEHNNEEQRRFLEFICELSNLTDAEKIYSLFSYELAHRFPFEVFTYYLMENDYLVGKNITITSEKYQPRLDEWAKSVINAQYAADNPVNPVSHAFILNRHLLFEDAQKLIEIADHREQMDLEDFPKGQNNDGLRFLRQDERTLLLIPIQHQNKPIGVCALHSLSSVVTVHDHDLRFLEHLCLFLGAEITNAKNFAIQQEQHREIARLNALLQGQVTELSEQASTDQLTGLYNFRTFKSEITKRLLISQKDPKENHLSIAILDIDHFKKFNDTYGHAAGNVVLAGVAAEVNKLMRKMDLACRYGGEEFVVLLENCDMEGIKTFAERMRSSIESARFNVEGQILTVTVSIGCAMSGSHDTPESLFERADKALYQAKHNGRNRVEVKA